MLFLSITPNGLVHEHVKNYEFETLKNFGFMKEIVVTEQNERRVKIMPCVKCGSENIELNDCGYSTFNVAWGRCIDCKHEVKLSPAPWDLNMELLAKHWNEENDPKILRHKYEQQIIEIQKLIDALPQ